MLPDVEEQIFFSAGTCLEFFGRWATDLFSGAPWVRKCGNLPIRENLVIT